MVALLHSLSQTQPLVDTTQRLPQFGCADSPECARCANGFIFFVEKAGDGGDLLHEEQIVLIFT